MATNDKYDRQLRLWGSSGQKAVAESCVVLIGPTACGTETLKNLILPGIGSYVIIDQQEDYYSTEYQSNFFLVPHDNNDNTNKSISTSTSKLKCRAEMACELLQELNSDVIGSWKTYNDDLLLVDWVSVLKDIKHTTNASQIIVIGSDLQPTLIELISSICNDYIDDTQQRCGVPFIMISSYGLLGIIRLQTPTLPLMDTKPRDTTPDLRLLYPFESLQLELAKFCQSDWTITSLVDDKQHGHIPYPYILHKAYNTWLQTNNTTNNNEQQQQDQEESLSKILPKTFAEKQQFQNLIKSMSRNYDNELNFQEAVTNAYLLYAPKSISLNHIDSLLQATEISSLSLSSNSNSSSSIIKFHKLLMALKTFLLNRPESTRIYCPPVHGTIPDMTSSTDVYVQLQRIYKEQSIQDFNEMKSYLSTTTTTSTSSADDTDTNPTVIVSDDELKTFIANVYYLDLLQTGTIQTEYSTTTVASDEICNELISSIEDYDLDDENDSNWKQSPLLWYLGFRSCQLFYKQYGYYPGSRTNDVNNNNDDDDPTLLLTNDAIQLQSCITLLLQTKYPKLVTEQLIQRTLLNCNNNTTTTTTTTTTPVSDYAIELVRYGNAEIHTISSIIGGIASQEVVKVITGQYVPINNTFIYNGIASIGATYKF